MIEKFCEKIPYKYFDFGLKTNRVHSMRIFKSLRLEILLLFRFFFVAFFICSIGREVHAFFLLGIRTNHIPHTRTARERKIFRSNISVISVPSNISNISVPNIPSSVYFLILKRTQNTCNIFFASQLIANSKDLISCWRN